MSSQRRAASTPARADGTASRGPNLINLSWLLKLRWGAIAGQLVTIGFVQLSMKIPLRLTWLLSVVALELGSNVGARLWIHRRQEVREAVIGLLLVLDVACLTGLLFLTGGPFNPFSFLYLVYIALAAVVLRARWTWALVALSLACSGALFFGHLWLGLPDADPDNHVRHMQMHLDGMWVAFAVAAAFIVHFVTRIQRALHRREADLAAERALAMRNERLASLATLAAGAAHELATPLGTIAVVTREIERAAERERPSSLEDVRLIRSEVDRCRRILDQMSADAGETPGEAPAPVRLGDLLATALQGLPRTAAVRLEIDGLEDMRLSGPPRALAQSLRALVRNGLEAGTPEAQVVVRGQREDEYLRLTVEDAGAGMTPEVLARAGEPFFTTKSVGRGMGLGLFLARTIAEKSGGRLDVASEPGRGTRVALRLRLMAGDLAPALQPSVSA